MIKDPNFSGFLKLVLTLRIGNDPRVSNDPFLRTLSSGVAAGYRHSFAWDPVASRVWERLKLELPSDPTTAMTLDRPVRVYESRNYYAGHHARSELAQRR
jgi:hypothetical protein